MIGNSPCGWSLFRCKVCAVRINVSKYLLFSSQGYGLALVVDILCGVLSGAASGPNVRRWATFDREANLGQCFIALDPSCFAPGFQGRLTDLVDGLRAMTPVNDSEPVLVPGDPERLHMEKVDAQGGVRYHENQLNLCVSISI